jgi:type II secretory pathway component PulF
MITPGQFRQRALFYQQLAQLTAAGLGLVNALEQLQRNPPARSYREPIGLLLEQVAHGYTLAESLRHVRGWLPELDIILLQAGEQSGRLDACFRLLADYYSERARLLQQMLGDLAYPAFLFHFAIFILPFSSFFMTGNWLAYLTKTFGIVLPIYAVVGLIVYATQSRHGEKWRAWLESVLHPVPVLGAARRSLALARLAAALEALLSAGVTIVEAWELAASASGSPALRHTVLGWRRQLDAGQTPAEQLTNSGKFPELFTNQYATGEISGQLDDTLRRLHEYYQEEGSRKLHALAQWTPRVIYLGVVLMIAYKIVQFWSGYFGQIQNVLGP